MILFLAPLRLCVKNSRWPWPRPNASLQRLFKPVQFSP